MVPGVTLRQIEAFYWCMRLGSFSDAASRLGSTQPAISSRIRDLETLVGTALFERLARGVRLTPAGRDLAEISERFISLGDELMTRVRLHSKLCGTIRIGAADSIALTWLPTLMSALGQQYPLLGVELLVDLSMHLQERLQDGMIDVGFMVGGLTGPDFVTRAIGELENAWMCSPLLDFSSEHPAPEELAAFPILTHSRGSHLHRMVETWFERSGTRPLRIQGCNSLSTMIKLTSAGLGVSVLPPSLVHREIGEGQLRVLACTEPLQPNVFVACWSSRPPTAIMRAVVDLAVGIAGRDPHFRSP